MDVEYKDKPFDGIMQKFYNVSKNSFYSKFKAEGEKYVDAWGDPEAVFDPSKGVTWASKHINNANITISFKKHLLRLSNYTFFPRRDTLSENMPRGWKLEASNDKVNWDLLHNVTDCEDVRYAETYKTYPCEQHGTYKHFRIMQIQENWGGANFFHVARIEFFGTIYSSLNPFIRQTCAVRRKGAELRSFND